MKFSVRPALYALLFFFAAISLGQGILNALAHGGDLQWHEGRLFLLGINPYRAFLDQVDLRPLLGGPNPTAPVQLPSALVLFTILGSLGYGGAKAVWAAANVLATFAFIYLLIENFGTRAFSWAMFALLTAALVASTPWRVAVGNGQHGVVAMALFMASLYAFDRHSPFLSGGLLALALLKYTLVLPFCALFLFNIRRTVLVLSVALAVHAALTVLAAILVGAPPLVLVRQSLEIAESVVAAGWLDFFAIYPTLTGSSALLIPVVLALFVVIATISVAMQHHDLRTAAIVALASIVIFYHRIYDTFVLIFVLYYLMERYLPGPDHPELIRPPWYRSVELWLGSAVIGYIFYLAKGIYVLQGRGILSADAVEMIDAFCALLTYALFLHLTAQALKANRRWASFRVRADVS